MKWLLAVVPALLLFPVAAHAEEDPKINAHRTTYVGGPTENGSRAMRHVRAYATMIETDVRVTRTGVPVLMHNRKVNETTNCRGYVSSMSWRSLKRCDVDGGGHVPSISELASYLWNYPSMWAQVELKVKLGAEGRARFLRALKPVRGRVILYSSTQTNAYVSSVAKSLGSHSAYWPYGGSTPNGSTVLRYGKYLIKNPYAYSTAAREHMIQSGIKFIAHAYDRRGYNALAAARVFAVSTGHADRM